MHCRLRTTASGLRTTDYEQRTADDGLRITEHEHGARSTEHGVRNTEHGAQSTEQGARTCHIDRNFVIVMMTTTLLYKPVLHHLFDPVRLGAVLVSLV